MNENKTIECRYCGGKAEYKHPTRHAKSYKCVDCGKFTQKLMY